MQISVHHHRFIGCLQMLLFNFRQIASQTKANLKLAYANFLALVASINQQECHFLFDLRSSLCIGAQSAGHGSCESTANGHPWIRSVEGSPPRISFYRPRKRWKRSLPACTAIHSWSGWPGTTPAPMTRYVEVDCSVLGCAELLDKVTWSANLVAHFSQAVRGASFPATY